jgi:exodeoxyribonuclease V alpha subunit
MSAATAPGSPPPAAARPGQGADVFAAFCAAGLWPGLGPGLAARLAEAGITGPEQVDPGVLAQLEGIGPNRAERLTRAFEAAMPCYRVAELLVPCRVPARFAGGAVSRLGAAAAQLLREDPWRLLAVPPIRPEQADWFARQLLGPQAHPQDPRRGRALVGHVVTQAARDGHTAVPARAVMTSLRRLRIEDPAAAIAAAVDEGIVLPLDDPGFADGGPRTGGSAEASSGAADSSAEGSSGGDGAQGGPGEDPGGLLLGLPRYAMAEDAVAEGLQRLLALAEPFPQPGGDTDGDGADGGGADSGGADSGGADSGGADSGGADGVGLDEAQRAAVQSVTGHGVCVLSGGPGTGKSRTVAAVVALAAGRGLRVALAAPTGRAAKRLEELAGAPATTLHRLLGAQGRPRQGADASGDGADLARPGAGGGPGPGGDAAWVFTRNEEWPLDADLVVVDEASMLDAELAAALLEACADGTRLLLVGDPAQLPSIGPGRVLADIIDSGMVPVTELTRLYRQQEGGIIAQLATAVRAGTLPPVDAPDREVVVVPARASASAARRVVQLVTDSIPRALGIPAADVQVITPVHKGAAGTIELNRVLKARLNPGPGARRGFDPGDRVVAVASHVDEGFTNGEVGTVTGLADDGLLVTFPAGPVTVPDKLLTDLRHGWALTVHRAQGSEWPAVVAVFPGEAAGMLSRPLVYTALTRAQRHLSVVHGAGPALARAVATVGERPRVTRLASLLRGAGPAG